MNLRFGKRITIIAMAAAIVCLALVSCAQEVEEAEEPNVFGPTFNVGEVIVNLADIGQARYAKAEVVLELDAQETFEEVNARSPQVRDIVIEIFSGQKASDILELEGREQIKNEIAGRINQVINVGRVEEVYFTTIVVQ